MPHPPEPGLPLPTSLVPDLESFLQELAGSLFVPEDFQNLALGLHRDDAMFQISPITNPTTPAAPTNAFALGFATEIGVAWQFVKLVGGQDYRVEVRRATNSGMSDAVSLGEFEGFFMVDDNTHVKWAASTTRFYQVRTVARSNQATFFSAWFPTVALSATTLAGGSTNADLQTRMDNFATIVQSLHLLPTKIQVFTSSGTWTKPSLASGAVLVTCVGGGGGGGSGRRGAAGTGRNGGSGGGGGGWTLTALAVDNLGATETVTVGAGGAGGAAVTVNDTSGSAGTAGGDTTFGTTVVNFAGGGGGGGGSAAPGGGGVGNGEENGGSGATASGTGGAGVNGVTLGRRGAAGGGGGGGITSADVESAGGAGGGKNTSVSGPRVIAGGAAGAAGGGTGGVGGSVITNEPHGGSGGGAGGSESDGVGAGGTGGAGGLYGAGGGGGGASTNGANSGAGGAGAGGICVVICW